MVLGCRGTEAPQLMAASEWTVPGRAVGFIAPGIASMLSDLDLTPEDIRGVACVRGPGSFTGLRLILAAAAGFAAGVGIPTAGLEYLPILAHQAGTAHHGTVHVLTYARRGQVYLQNFRGQALAPAKAMRATQALELIRRDSDNPLVLGSGLRKNPEVLEALTADGIRTLPPHFDSPSTSALLSAALQAEYTQDDIRPLYIRVSDAEENLETIAAKRGLAPDEARKRLHEYE